MRSGSAWVVMVGANCASLCVADWVGTGAIRRFCGAPEGMGVGRGRWGWGAWCTAVRGGGGGGGRDSELGWGGLVLVVGVRLGGDGIDSAISGHCGVDRRGSRPVRVGSN